MKKPIILWALAAAALVLAISLYMYLKPKSSKQKTLAIFTTLSHPALDSVDEGFMSGIKATFGSDIALKHFNAEANAQQANMIARQISQSDEIVGTLAIGTLAAQTLAKVEKSRPIVIAAVSDPLVVVPKEEGSNVCGLTDTIDADFQIMKILELLPELKSLSLLYSPHEGNSSSMVKKLEQAAKLQKITVNLVGVSDTAQIKSASMSACQQSDAVLIPLDNQLVASMPAVIKATKDMPCAVITSNESPIHQGASIAFGVDYRRIGLQAALLMAALLDDKTPADIAFIEPSKVELYINDRVVREKGLKLDKNALEKAISVKE